MGDKNIKPKTRLGNQGNFQTIVSLRSSPLQTIVTSTTQVQQRFETPFQNGRPVLYPLKPAIPQQIPADFYQPGPRNAGNLCGGTVPFNPPTNVEVPITYVDDLQRDEARQIKIGHVGELLIGGITGVKHGAIFADALQKFKTEGFSMGNLKGLGMASLKAGGLSAGITGAISAVQNIGGVASGKISAKWAISNVAADSVGGMVSGTTAGIGAGAATLALRSFGIAGLPLTIGAAVAGAVGGMGGSRLYEATGLKERFARATHEFFS